MDAVEIMKEYGEMCCTESEYGCAACELSYEFNGTGEACEQFIRNNPARAVEIIENYKSKTSKNTRQSEFLKMFPKARTEGETVDIDPCEVDVRVAINCKGRLCEYCREDYWLEEIHDEK